MGTYDPRGRGAGLSAGRRPVHFAKDEEPDSLESMLRRTFGREREDQSDDAYAENPSEVKKSWKVSDAQLQQYLANLCSQRAAAESECTLLPSEPLQRLSKSQSLKQIADDFAASRISGASRAVGLQEKISINIFFADSGDMLCLRVSPDLQIGPAKQPQGNRFTDMYGLGASTKGFAQVKSFDYKYRQFGTTVRPGWCPTWKECLKGMIEHVCGAAISQQTILSGTIPLTADDRTLSSYGVRDGSTINLRIRTKVHLEPCRDVLLACSLRKQRQEELQAAASPDGLGSQAAYTAGVASYSLRHSKLLKKCRSDGDVRLMPRWIWQANPHQFEKTAFSGGKAFADFGSSPIYLPDARDHALSSVRQKVCGNSTCIGMGLLLPASK